MATVNWTADFYIHNFHNDSYNNNHDNDDNISSSSGSQLVTHLLWEAFINISFNSNNSGYVGLGSNQNISTTGVPDQGSNNVSNLNESSPWQTMSKAYQGVHGYFSFVVCVFGILSNVLNIIVLTRKHMRSPVNFILTALAIADILTMSPYTVMAIYLFILNKPECSESHTEPWMYFVMFHNLFIIACHMMATWLTVALAVFRYIFVCRHQVAVTMCSMRRARLTVLIVFVVTIVSNVPYLFMYQVKNFRNETHGEPCYWVANSDFAEIHPMYVNFVHWLYGVVIKIMPCILLAYLSTLIILAMQRAKRRRARLLNTASRVMDHDSSSHEHNRTTMMLVAVVLFFIVTEIPQGIVALISAVDNYFYDHVFFHFGDIMDILVLINSAVNFILYCIMSKQFRDTFTSLFVTHHLPAFLHHHRGVKQHPNGGDYTMVHTQTTHV